VSANVSAKGMQAQLGQTGTDIDGIHRLAHLDTTVCPITYHGKRYRQL